MYVELINAHGVNIALSIFHFMRNCVLTEKICMAKYFNSGAITICLEILKYYL